MLKPVFVLLRTIYIAAILVAAAAFAPASAQDNLSAMPLDTLFAELKSAHNEAKANQISTHIWRRWLSPKDPDLAVLMTEAITAKAVFNIRRTMELLEEITQNYPDYAEGWNLRATLHFELSNYEQSLADIAETLVREPRHYGALSGRAMIHMALGNKAEARQSIIEARKIHPFIAEHPPFSNLVEPMVRI